MLLVGLTGNYGMGKSLALCMFGKLGALTIDADEIVGELLEDKKVIDNVGNILGGGALGETGGIDRKKVSDIVFGDPGLRAELEDMLHPLVFKKIDDIAKDAGERVVVVEAALIFERGYEGRFYKTVVVKTEEETALRRLKDAGVDREDALRRLRAQMPVEQKAKRADFVIDNEGAPEDVKKQAELIYGELLKECRR